MRDACMLREVPIRQLHVWEECFGLFIDAPPAHHAHVRNITKTPGLTLDLVLLVRSMNAIMAPLAECDEIVRALTSCFARLDMVDLQDAIFRFPLTPLALMLVTKEHILTDIPEPYMRSLLVFLSLNLWMANFLQAKLRYLDRCPAHWQDLVNQADRFEMTINLVLHRRGKPSLRLLSIEKACLAIACLSVSSGTTELPTSC